MKRKKRVFIRIKYRLRHVRRRLHKRKERWNQYWKNEFADTGKGLSAITAVLLAFLLGITFMEVGVNPAVPLFIAGAAAGVLLFFLTKGLLKYLLRLLAYVFHIAKSKEKTNSILLFVLTAGLIIQGAYRSEVLLIVALGSGVALVEVFFGRSLWALFRNRRRTLPVVLIFLFSLTVNVFLAYFLFGEGFPDEDLKKHRDFAETVMEEQRKSADVGNTELENEETGKSLDKVKAEISYPVASFSYGINEAEYRSDSTDLSMFVTVDGFSEWLRTLYWKFGVGAVPLAGSVWYPDVSQLDSNIQKPNFPILFIVHGNHIMTEASHLGYQYLGEYLAARGYIVVSVDENYLNGFINGGLDHENDARAVLLLENIRWMKEWSKKEESPLYQIADFENIILAGHSRGGEAVAIAALFNELDRYPEEGSQRMNYHFSIRSLIAIAPSCNQYAPAGKTPKLTDINYYLIHGSHDGDVSSMMGMKQYEEVVFSGEKQCFKTYLYIGGANHGQFNSSWGEYDNMLPTGWYLNTADLLSEEEQQEILCVSVHHFLEASIRDSREDRDFFSNSGVWKEGLPSTVYTQGYCDSTYRVIADYEEDSNLETISSGLGRITTKRLSHWSEQQLSEDTGTYTYWLNDHAVRLRWSDYNVSYQLELFTPIKQTEQSLLCFDIMNLEVTEEGEDLQLLDFSIVLTDTKGKTVKSSLLPYGYVVPPLPVRLSKTEYLTGEECYKHQFTSIRIPLSAFPDLDYAAIASISLRFDKTETGEVMLDNIGFSGPME